MNPTFQTRAPLFLADVFEHFKDKDCLLLCIPENCTRPAITSGFRFVRGDPSISTIARLRQQDEDHTATGNHKSKHSKHDKPKPKPTVLYAFHRDELPFLANFTLDLSANDEVEERSAEPVIVKGMGVKGFGLTVRSWTNKCFEFLGFGGKKEKKKRQKAQESRPRAATSENGNLTSIRSDDGPGDDEAGRNTIH